MMATAFIGYVLPFGQMSLWGIVGASYDEMNYFAISIPFNRPETSTFTPFIEVN